VIKLHTAYSRPAKNSYKTRIAIAGDLHEPYSKDAYLEEFYRGVSRLKPNAVVQMGDAYDLNNFTVKYTPDPTIRPDYELVEGRKRLERFWARVKKYAPRARRLQLLGNHDARILKYIWAGGPRMAALAARYDDFRDLWKFNGVESARTGRDIFEIDGILFTHGWMCGVPGKHAARFGRNTVVGHTHKQGLIPVQKWDGVIWEMNVGYMGDEKAPVFTYNASAFIDATPGYGIIDRDGPRLVTL
jgi:hypothetical protein